MIADSAPLAPLLVLAAAAVAVVVLDWFVEDARLAPAVAAAACGAAAFLGLRGWAGLRPGRAIESFPRAVVLPGGDSGQAALVRLDAFGLFLVVAIALVGALVVLLGASYVAARRLPSAEYHALVLVAVLAMMTLVLAGDLMLMFLAIETFSIALYLLCALERGARLGQEAAFKYFVLGAFSAGFLLYGVALIYAVTGTTDLVLVGRALAAGAGDGAMARAALGLLLVGLGFKVAAAPFHQWTPDVYAGAPLPVAALMAAGTKMAAFAAVARVLWTVFGANVGLWAPLTAALAVATMLVGNLAALVQSDLKRMLGYSAVAHAGYLLVAVAAGGPDGLGALLYYLVIYALANLGAFAVLAAIGPIGPEGREAARLDDLRGLGRRQPWLAAALTLSLLALTGLPPTAGFLAKWLVFQAAVGADLVWLAAVVVANSVLSAFYYLRPVALMTMAAPEGEAPEPREVDTPAAVAIAVAATVLALGLVITGPLVDGARASAILDLPAAPAAASLGAPPAP